MPEKLIKVAVSRYWIDDDSCRYLSSCDLRSNWFSTTEDQLEALKRYITEENKRQNFYKYVIDYEIFESEIDKFIAEGRSLLELDYKNLELERKEREEAAKQRELESLKKEIKDKQERLNKLEKND